MHVSKCRRAFVARRLSFFLGKACISLSTLVEAQLKRIIAVSVQKPKSSKNSRPQPLQGYRNVPWLGHVFLVLASCMTFGLINAGAVRRRSDGSKRRACTEWHCVQVDNDPYLHHPTTCEARVSVGVGKPFSLIATSTRGPQSSAMSRISEASRSAEACLYRFWGRKTFRRIRRRSLRTAS